MEIDVEAIDRNTFAHYFLRELSVLQDDCASFAAKHPQIAANLGLGSEGSADPHVNQLIESVAFIAARLKRHIDGISGTVALNILQAVAPYLCAPIPCMSVIRLSPLSKKVASPTVFPKNQVLVRARAVKNESLFTLVNSDTKIWPLLAKYRGRGGEEISNALTPGITPLVFEVTHFNAKLKKNEPGELTFFVSGSLSRALAAIDAIQLGVAEVKMFALDNSWSADIGNKNIELIGYDQEHRILTDACQGNNVGAAMQEFLNFPRRFCFFKICNLSVPVECRGFKLVLGVKPSWASALDAAGEYIQLNCFPAVNKFRPTAIAVKLINSVQEYQLPKQTMSLGSCHPLIIESVSIIENGICQEVPEF